MTIHRPLDDYSPDWGLFYAQHPGYPRAVGADTPTEGAEAEGQAAEGAEAEKGKEAAEPAAHAQEDGGKDEGKNDAEAKPDQAEWRDAITDKEARKQADRFNSLDDVFKSLADFRKRENQARVPGKDADEKEVAAFRKALEIPETPEGYEFPVQEGEELTDEQKASHEAWAKKFHDLNVPAPVAKTLMEELGKDLAALQEAQVEADNKFAQESEEALKKEWGGDYDKNKAHANRAVAEILGDNLEDARKLETKDGKFIFDHPIMVKAMAKIGREMSEGGFDAMTDSERETAEEELRGLRDQITEAQGKGETKRANELYQKEQALIAKVKGNQSIVGAGRAA